MAIEKILVPDLGGAESVDVIEIAVAEGDRVEQEQSLVVLESDKATMDVPSTLAGVVKKVLVKEGDSVGEGSAIVELEVDESTGEKADAVESESKSKPTKKEQPAPTGVKQGPEKQKGKKSPVATTPEPQLQSIEVPDTGGDQAVEVIELSVKVGDQVQEGDALVVLESDKATMEVPAPAAGEITELKVVEGDKVSTGDVIAMISGVATQAAPPSKPAPSSTDEKQEPAQPKKPAQTESAPAASEAAAATGGEAHAGPAVRQLARELGVDLSKVPATGPRQRVLKDDVHAYVKNAFQNPQAGTAGGASIPVVPPVDFSKFGEIDQIKMSKIQKLTAANMQRAWINMPLVTQFDDADITDLEAFRKSLKAEGEKRGVKVTPVPFLIRAVATAIEQNPEFNRSLGADGEHFVQKKYIHIGVAVDTPRGLVVPVVRDADKKGIWQLSQELTELAQKARDGKLAPAEMQGACFTISSLGAAGGTGFTPIVNTPEVGILGVSRAEIRPVWNGSEFVPRQMLPLSLSYDHRAINGGDAGRFMTTLVALIGDIRRLLM